MLLFLSVVVLLLSVVQGKQRETIQWRQCREHPSDSPLRMSTLDVQPYPIILPEDNAQPTVQLTLSGSNNETIHDMDLDILLHRITRLVNIKVPCVRGVGSCYYDSICSRIENTSKPFTLSVLTMMQQGGMGPEMLCPFRPSTLSVSDYTINLPALPNIPLLRSAVKGTYRIKAKIYKREENANARENGRLLGCYQVTVKVVKECTGWFCFKRRR